MNEELIPNLEETAPWCEEYPFRIIKSNECQTGLVEEYRKKRSIIRNQNAEFPRELKYWTFVKVLKSTTSVVHWLFKINGQYFAASQSMQHKGFEQVMIFASDRRGTYNICNPLCIYRYYVDLESAIDRFAQEYIAYLIETRDPLISFILPKDEDNATI